MSGPTLTLLEADMLSVIEAVLREVASAEKPYDGDSYLPPHLVAELQRVRDSARRL